jgi:hypothetical protein
LEEEEEKRTSGLELRKLKGFSTLIKSTMSKVVYQEPQQFLEVSQFHFLLKLEKDWTDKN